MIQFTKLLNQPDFGELTSKTFFESVSSAYFYDEKRYLLDLIAFLDLNPSAENSVRDQATQLIETIRQKENVEDSLDALLREYNLTTEEGLILMCLAEAFLRIPDNPSIDAFIRDRLAGVDWQSHKGKSDQSLVNFATWGLILTGKIVDIDNDSNPIKKLRSKVSEPIIRAAMRQAMKIMGKQFVLGETIEEALKNGLPVRHKGYTYTYDMLGEAAITDEDAKRYYGDYRRALHAVGKEKAMPHSQKPSLSIKLSALFPRYEEAQEMRVMSELFDRVKALVLLGIEMNVEISIDAEEMDRLELSLKLFEKLLNVPVIREWGGLGLVVQGYSKRTLATLVWTTLLAKELKVEIPLRLVKGAYWDTEIKEAQVRGLSHYPVFTRKENTDIAYLAAAKFLLSDLTKGAIRPQFATHNAHTVTSIIAMAKSANRPFEFQRLHGMGEALYDEVMANHKELSVRIYAPVGNHKDLLPYLVRRLLENGANSSFVHQLVDPSIPVGSLVVHPLNQLEKYDSVPNDRIPLPFFIYNEARRNSAGLNLSIEAARTPFMEKYNHFISQEWHAEPIINGKSIHEGLTAHTTFAPFDLAQQIGTVTFATEKEVTHAIDQLDKAWFEWNETPVETRATIIETMANRLEEHMVELIAICSMEAGKTIQDGMDEVREAIDFCRYYAIEARKHCTPQKLQGVSGEENLYYSEGRGVFACVSPWNFPVSIFVGQIVAALVTGNCVLIKPAESTTLIAYRVVELLIQAGVPTNVIAFIPGSGSALGEIFTNDPRVVGVCFTGSTAAAKTINRNLANREGAIPALIAETGGQNVMFVDSTSLPEQVVVDAVQSAFVTAGQRCSALRVLYLQEDVADHIIQLLTGALKELVVGLPYFLNTDISSVINEDAQKNLQSHIDEMKQSAKLIGQATIDPALNGYFIPPTIFEIDSIKALDRENFGPILHVVRYKNEEILSLVEEVNATGYGLTMGIHSRNEALQRIIEKHARVGNLYINRNQVGAVVGVQPFGGRGLSGTGPKAGGPHYLPRFMDERSTSINTAAIGGDARLLSLNSDRHL